MLKLRKSTFLLLWLLLGSQSSFSAQLEITFTNNATWVTLPIGQDYNDDDMTATSSADGDVTAKVTRTGKVNNRKTGTYPLTYSVTDSTGKTAEVVRNVRVTGYQLLDFNPLDVAEGGMIPLWQIAKGGALPWDANYYSKALNGTRDAGFDPTYIQQYYPDSAGTATAFHTGTKTYVGAIGVDIFEKSVIPESLVMIAIANNRSGGVISNVPWSHATPAAGIASVSGRNKDTQEDQIQFYLKSDKATPKYGFQDENNNGTWDWSDADGDGAFDDHDTLTENLLDAHGNIVDPTDNIFDQVMINKPTLVMGGGHPESGSTSYMDVAEVAALQADSNGDGIGDLGYKYLEPQRGVDASDALFAAISNLDPDNGDRLFAAYSGGLDSNIQNLPWRTADSDYDALGLNGYPVGNSDYKSQVANNSLTADSAAGIAIRNENATIVEMTEASLNFLGKDDQGFFLLVEIGDLDWSAHANNMDLLLGTALDMHDVVATTDNWITTKSSYDETLLIVTADHDHYLTLLPNFPQKLVQALLSDGGISINHPFKVGYDQPLNDENQTPVDSENYGHFWGPIHLDGTGSGWTTHTARPVPMYYRGPQSATEQIQSLQGQGYTVYGKQVAGTASVTDDSGTYGFIDQVQIQQVAKSWLTSEGSGKKNAILIIGDGMGWEMVRAGAIHKTILEDLKTSFGIDLSNGIDNADLTRKDEALTAYANKTLDDYYTAGSGTGLSFMNLPGYTLVTDANTVIDGNKGNSMIQGGVYEHNSGEGPLRTSSKVSLHPVVANSLGLGNNWYLNIGIGILYSTPETDWIFHKDLGYLLNEPSTSWYYSTHSDFGWLYIDEQHVNTEDIANTKALTGFVYAAKLQTWIYISAADKGDGTTTILYYSDSLGWKTFK